MYKLVHLSMYNIGEMMIIRFINFVAAYTSKAIINLNSLRIMKLRNIILLSFFLTGITGCFTVRSTNRFSYSKLTPAQYATVLNDSSRYYLIDVRTAKEYKRSHLPGAVNFSYLNFHIGRDIDSLDRNTLVLVYCQTCHRSPLAARKMKKMGFRKVFDLKGGYRKWTGFFHVSRRALLLKEGIG